MQKGAIFVKETGDISMTDYDWGRWLSLKEGFNDVGSPEDNFKFDRTKEGIANDHDKIKDDLFSAIWDKHEEDARQFFDSIAQRDPEVKSLLNQLDSSKHPSELEEPKHPSDIDEFEPPIPDKGHSDGFGGDE
jgi:hypothetical protein